MPGSRPPLPREHGAWMMLYTPVLTGLAAFRPLTSIPSLLLLAAITGAYLAQSAAGVLIRGRRGRGAVLWLGLYAGLVAGSSGVLILVYGMADLVWLGLAGVALFGRQVWFTRATRQRVERSHLGQILTVAVLALGAPAAHVVARGGLAPVAWHLWAAGVLYFAGSVFYVKMRTGAARVRGTLDPATRWRLGRPTLVYHLLLAGLLVALQLVASPWRPGLVAVAYAPALLRAFWGWGTLARGPESLRRTGVKELLAGVWFAAWMVAAAPHPG